MKGHGVQLPEPEVLVEFCDEHMNDMSSLFKNSDSVPTELSSTLYKSLAQLCSKNGSELLMNDDETMWTQIDALCGEATQRAKMKMKQVRKGLQGRKSGSGMLRKEGEHDATEDPADIGGAESTADEYGSEKESADADASDVVSEVSDEGESAADNSEMEEEADAGEGVAPESPQIDEAFLNDMEDWVQEEEKKRDGGKSDAEEDDDMAWNELEGPDLEDTEDVSFEDFFGNSKKTAAPKFPLKSTKGDDKEEAELERMLDRLEAEAGSGSEDDEDLDDDDDDDAEEDLSGEDGEASEDNEDMESGEDLDGEELEEEDLEEDENEDAVSAVSEGGDEVARGKTKAETDKESLTKFEERLRALDEEVNELEAEQLAEKHWSMRGEAYAKERPLNSLLDQEVELPFSHFAGNRAMETATAAAGEDEEELPKASRLGAELDQLIKQRVADETYDDVVRVSEESVVQRLAAEKQKAAEDPLEGLDFSKPKMGLGDIYEEQYRTEMMGQRAKEAEALDKSKKELLQKFAELMHRLDSLSHSSFQPRPPMVTAGGKSLRDGAAITVEEAVPIAMAAGVSQATPEELAPKQRQQSQEELSREERSAVRNLQKERRRAGIRSRILEGTLTQAGARQRQQKLQEKNRVEKEASKKRKDLPTAPRKKKLRTTELMAMAAQAAHESNTAATRQAAKRKERQEGAAKEHDSKKLKL